MRSKAQLFLALIASCALIVSAITFVVLQNKKELAAETEREAHNKWDLAMAEDALQQSKAMEALELARRHQREIAEMTPHGIKWLELSIKVGHKIQDGHFLASLYSLYPAAFKRNEPRRCWWLKLLWPSSKKRLSMN